MKYYWLIILLGFISCTAAYTTIPLGDEFLFIQSIRNGYLDLFFFYYTQLGQSAAYILGAIICALLVNYRSSLLFGIGGILVLAISVLLKLIFGHPRPVLGWDGFNDSVRVLNSYYPLVYDSFPSGHTISGVIIFGLLVYFSKNKWTAVVFGIAALLMATSRIYLVLHFTKDIAFGMICGLLLLFLITKVIDPYLKRFKLLENSVIIKKQKKPTT